MSSDFEAKSGSITQPTSWGNWSQTIQDITIEVFLEKGTRGREVSVDIKPGTIELRVRGENVFQGKLSDKVVVDESTWTIEDQKLLRILLCKALSGKCWPSLLDNQYQADQGIFQKMRDKIELERYQMEHPGFDFSEDERQD